MCLNNSLSVCLVQLQRTKYKYSVTWASIRRKQKHVLSRFKDKLSRVANFCTRCNLQNDFVRTDTVLHNAPNSEILD